MAANGRLQALGLIIVCSIALSATGLEAQAVRSPGIGLDSRYHTHDSDVAIAEFGVDLLSLGPWLGEQLPAVTGEDGPLWWDGPEWGRARRDLVAFFVSSFVGTAYEHAAHEFGHATRLAAVGFDPRMAHRSWSDVDQVAAAVRDGVGTSSFFRYFVSSLGDRSGATVATTERVRRPVDLVAFEERWEAHAIMGGLNAESAVAHRLAREIRAGRGHAGMLSTYLNARLAIRQYGLGTGVLNDLSNILMHYDARGIDLGAGQLRSASLRSVLLSASTWELVWSTVSMLRGRGAEVPVFRVGPVYMPDVGVHLMPSGLSYSVQSGVDVAEGIHVMTGFEWMAEGDRSGGEVAAGIRWSGSPVFAESEVRIGDGWGGDLSAGWRATGRIDVIGTASRYDLRNLYGARHATYVEGSEPAHVFGVRVQYRWFD